MADFRDETRTIQDKPGASSKDIKICFFFFNEDILKGHKYHIERLEKLPISNIWTM